MCAVRFDRRAEYHVLRERAAKLLVSLRILREEEVTRTACPSKRRQDLCDPLRGNPVSPHVSHVADEDVTLRDASEPPFGEGGTELVRLVWFGSPRRQSLREALRPTVLAIMEAAGDRIPRLQGGSTTSRLPVFGSASHQGHGTI